MPTVKIVIREDKIDKAGEAPLYLRVTKDRKARFISLEQKVEPKFWDKNQSRVKKGHPNSSRLNSFLKMKEAEADGIVLTETTTNKIISTRQLKESIVGKEPPMFFKFADKLLERFKTSCEITTCQNYYYNIQKFREFNNYKDIAFSDITWDYIKQFDAFLQAQRSNGKRTSTFALRILKMFFRKAIDENIITSACFPFPRKMEKVETAQRQYLNEEQFQAFKDFPVVPGTTTAIVKDMFHFCCIAGGMRISDLIELKWKHIDESDTRWAKVIRKTKRQHQVKMTVTGLEILKKYRTNETTMEDFIFPFLDNSINYEKDKAMYYKHRDKISKRVNNNLKKIGKALNLPYSLSFHLSRHTFATRLLRKGGRMEYVSKILDHTLISTTQPYAKIVNAELDKTMELLND